MKKHFRYDYNYKLSIISCVLSTIFFTAALILYNKNMIGFCVFVVLFLVDLIGFFVFIKNQGVQVRNGIIKVSDYFWFTKIRVKDLKFAELRELTKEKKSNLYGFFHEFYYPTTYLYDCKYVYNNGKVFQIIFHLKDGTKRKTYFGWMYKEKNKTKVDKVIKRLEIFISSINLLIK